MEFYKIYKKYINNNYFPLSILESTIKQLFNNEDECRISFDKIKQLYKSKDHSKFNESQLEDDLIKPILKNILGYEYLNQETISFQGKQMKPDYLLFENSENKSKYIENKNIKNTLVVFEAKEWNKDLDGKKIKDSPHLQLVTYNLFLGLEFGILSNGQKWRFYDLRERKSEKIFYEINVHSIVVDDNYEAFKYFYYVFRKQYFLATESKEKNVDIMFEEKMNFITSMEEDLKNVIYGRNSIIEKIGRSLYCSYPDYDLKILFEHSVVMAYRLLFIAYFETKYQDYLFEGHDNYKNVALFSLFNKLKSDDSIEAYQYLTSLFEVLDKGSVPFKIPLLNGGLFDPDKAPLFDYNKNKTLFTNDEILSILTELLLIKESDTTTLFGTNIKNFAMMSVTHIGNIYEGLLQFSFRISKDNVYYIEYKDAGKLTHGYFDEYDYNKLTKKKENKNNNTYVFEKIEPNTLYLVNTSNSRKMSASYYTPQSISRFMVGDVVKSILEKEEFKTDILSVKIIDNACGSGHFLVDVLDLLTERVYAEIEGDFSYLYNLIQTEKEKIIENLHSYRVYSHEVDELQILKRILLKKIIYGVDLESFAVELTRLSLWLKTFIFGTPLSFIEHHIKQGNSLIGSTIEEGNDIIGTEKKDIDEEIPADLFAIKFRDLFAELGHIASRLSSLADSTTEEIEESKAIYKKEIEPKQEKLALILDLITYNKMQTASIKSKNSESMPLICDALFNHLEDDIYNGRDKEAIKEIKRLSKKYSFFHYDIAFPEIKEKGFYIIIGNPPWDKVKFDDKDFFSQYRSNYRTMSVSEKKETQNNLLGSESYKYIQDEYYETENKIATVNAYYKKYYPMNAGAGDNNLFRLFIERNINMLKKNGTLIYVTPSAWTYEEGSLNIRKHIFDNLEFNYFYQFENRLGIFPDVHRSYKFAVWSITNTKKLNENVPAFFMEHDTERLYNKTDKKDLIYPLSVSRRLFPNSYIMLEINDEYAFSIIDKMYSVGHAIDENYIDFRNELHMTADNDLFIESYEDGLLPLYEGKMIHQFNPNFAKPKYWLNKDKLNERIISKEIKHMIDDIFSEVGNPKSKEGKEAQVLTYLHLDRRGDLEKFIKFDYEYPRISFRDISGNVNERSLISAIISPNASAGNTLWLSMPKKYKLDKLNIIIEKYSIKKLLFVNAIFNSIVLDYVLRFLIDIHVNKTYLMQLPLIHASDSELETPEYRKIWQNALAITCYYESSFTTHPLATGLKIPKTKKEVDFMQIENDVFIAKLYNITKEDMTTILSTFKVLQNKRPEYIATLKSKM